MFTLVNDENKKTVKLNFYEKGGSYSYGCYPGASFGEYLNASMKVNDGGFKAAEHSIGGSFVCLEV